MVVGGRYLLIGILILAVLIRFLYFPDNVYFGYDQARDAFISQSILMGDLKIVGPPTSVPGLFHGPLYYYIFAPIYFIAGGNPEAVSAFLRVVNAVGVLIVFFIGSAIFNRKVGLMSALLFAFSFEQTQFAIYLNHPSLAVISVLIFYLGLALLFFKNYQKGFLISVVGLGLSLQFEMAEAYLILTFLLMLIIFRSKLKLVSKKNYLISALSFLAIILTFVISEVKFKFQNLTTILSIFSGSSKNTPLFQNLQLINFRTLNDNLVSFEQVTFIVVALLLLGLFLNLYRGKFRMELIFLIIWFFSGNIPYYKDTAELPLYYHIAGSTAALLVFTGFLIFQLSKYSKLFPLLLLIPIISNLSLITTLNPKGSIPAINVQSGMLLSDQKKVLDYMYTKADGKEFSVYGLTMPLYINMTWAYLFEWYGKRTYGYLPIWGGENASGYYGNLKVEKANSKLPETRFFVMEPTRGIPAYFIEGFKTEENVFTNVLEERNFGEIIVQLRKSK